MGGAGGKKARHKARESETTTLGGKFLSVGSREEQASNLALVVKLMGEIGIDGERHVRDQNDLNFLSDCRIKLNQGGGYTTFGWRQVEVIVRIHKMVEEARVATN